MATAVTTTKLASPPAASQDDIPSISTILASKDFLSHDDASIAIVRVGKYVVKYWANAPAQAHEAAALRWVAANTTVRVPRLAATLTDKKTGLVFNVLEHIPGPTLADAWDGLNKAERAHITTQLTAAVSSLRSPPSPGYIGGLNRTPCRDYMLWSPGGAPARCGPFDAEGALVDALALHMADAHAPTYVLHIRDLLCRVLAGHRIVFTHADLQMKNIILAPAGTLPSSAGRKFALYLIDWQAAGWYPEFWEYTSALARCRDGRDEDWLAFVRAAFAGFEYAPEFLAMHLVQDLLIY